MAGLTTPEREITALVLTKIIESVEEFREDWYIGTVDIRLTAWEYELLTRAVKRIQI